MNLQRLFSPLKHSQKPGVQVESPVIADRATIADLAGGWFLTSGSAGTFSMLNLAIGNWSLRTAIREWMFLRRLYCEKNIAWKLSENSYC